MRGEFVAKPSVEDTLAPAGRASGRSFVGRAEELEELRASLDDAGAGRGSVALVTGEAGIGKTRLMQEVAGAALDQGWRVLSGRCWEEGGAPAYWPWIQVVRAAGGELERLAQAMPERPSSAAVDPESVRFELFDAVTRFLTAAAEAKPILVVLDDLHAADAPSLLLLRFLGQSIRETRILVLGSYREGERRVVELATAFAELARVARRIPLRGLDVAEVGAYLTRVGDGAALPATAARLQAITAGNPFFLGEVVRLRAAEGLLTGEGDLADPGVRVPEEVRAVIRRRVGNLSTDAISVLRIAAVTGREFDLRVLEGASGVGLGRLLDVLGEAVDAGVLYLTPTPGRYSFAHELVRETLYEDLAASRRAELHLAIGRVLEERNRADLDPHLSEIAHHLTRAAPLGDLDEAVGYLTRAGERASRLLAYEEAILHYGRALELHSAGEDASPERRGELLLRLGDSQWRSGDTRAARSSFEGAVEVARRLGAGEMLARAALGYVVALGGFLLFARFEAGATGAGLLEEALAALPEEDTLLRAQLLSRLAVELYTANEPVEHRMAVSEEAIELARRLDDPEALVTALHSRHWALAAPELVLGRLAHTDEMLRAAEEAANREMEFLAHNARFHCFLELGERRSMETEMEAMAQIAELTSQPFFLWHTVCLRTVRAILDGRFDEAEELARYALEIGRLRHAEYPAYVFRFAQLVAIRWAQGRLDTYWEQIRDHGDRFPWVPRWRDALAAAELRDAKAARAEVERHAARNFADLPRDGLWTLHLCSLAEACVLLGDEARGALLYELLLPHGERNAVSYTQQPFGPAGLRLGMLAGMLGRVEDAERHFATALARCDRLGARAVRARVLYEHAKLLSADREGADAPRAAAMLDEAARLAEDLGMPGILARVSSLGDAPRAARPTDAVFRREGDFWTIAYEGQTLRLKDRKGLGYIAALLGLPGREVHVLELIRAGEAVEARHPGGSDGDNLQPAAAEGAPVLDAEAKEAYRRRLHELGEDLAEARDWQDPERVARLEEEIDSLTDELARAVGLGGRDRRLPSPAERARVSVTKAIKTAITAVERHHSVLGSHLDASITTGRFCSYAPPGERPPRWML
jgi:tetratricopeptide (TPR) repeat protein